ncbi:MAG TPA: hypothetical protein EYN41_00010 [Flavobacteriales bacterium]|nr:hypothetical protein [Flavobacteriales bacterium]HIO66688.1 hypothetical protein [Flavobacteriales bacterium]
MRTCPSCGNEVTGRSDKKFCSHYCKSSFHYVKNREDENNLFRKIDGQLKLNRRILKEYNKGGKAMVRIEVLHDVGFDPKYFTSYWKSKGGGVYLFCYEYGFKQMEDNGKQKYLLVQWQDYMN